MKSFYIKQKLMSLRENFRVYDEQEREVYIIEGSLMKASKTYVISDMQRRERALIERKLRGFLPTFHVEVDGRNELKIKKHFSILKAKYSVEGTGIEVSGNFWDMDFEVLQKGRLIGQVSKQWLSWGDTYQIDVLDEEFEMIIIALVVAIDRVKAEQSFITSMINI